MIRLHLLWRDHHYDNLTSWTTSARFMYTHGKLRQLQGGKDVFFYLMDRRKATDAKGDPVELHYALDLAGVMDIEEYSPAMSQAQFDLEVPNQHRSKFNHEYCTYGLVRIPENETRAASLEELEAAGLHNLFPDMPTHNNLRDKCPRGLSDSLKFARPRKPYNKIHPFTAEEVGQVLACARLYNPGSGDEERSAVKTPLCYIIEHCTGKMRDEDQESIAPLVHALKATGLYTGKSVCLCVRCRDVLTVLQLSTYKIVCILDMRMSPTISPRRNRN